MDSEDPLLSADDRELERLLYGGLAKIFPDLGPSDIAYSGVHRAKFVQPLPLVQHRVGAQTRSAPTRMRPFQILNTSMLRCATLNNDEVVAFAQEFVSQTSASWAPERRRPSSLSLGDQVA
jgi:hypothetical protein